MQSERGRQRRGRYVDRLLVFVFANRVVGAIGCTQIDAASASRSDQGTQIEPDRAPTNDQGTQIEPARAPRSAQGTQIKPASASRGDRARN